MNALVKKEVRLLLPAWTVAMLLVIVAPWIFPLYDPRGGLIRILFPVGLLILGIASFGQEFNSGGLSNLLGQPLDRHRIWRTKTAILALGFLIVCCAAFASFLYRCNIAAASATFPVLDVTRTEFRLDTLELLVVSALVTFSGGLWTTLLLRQMTGAFWFTLLIPGAIAVVIAAALQFFVLSESSINWVIIIVLVAYSIAGFFFARHLFLQAQDTQWTGGQIAIFSRGKDFQSTAIPATRHARHWLSHLFWKEIHLHQITLLFAAFLLPVNVVSLCILKIHPRFNNPNVTSALEAIGILWLLMPLVIGSTAIAEERRMGILESHLCAPISRRTQLFVKFLVALALSLFLGGAIPSFMDGADHPDFWIIAIAAATFFVSFYASSFARSTVQAIGLAVVIWMIIGGLLYSQIMPLPLLTLTPYGGSAISLLGLNELGLLILRLYLGSAILVLVFGILTFWNFNWLHENRKLWRRNVISVVVAFAGIFALSNSIYYRAWELFLPIQPPPGPVRIGTSAQLRTANSAETTLYVVTPAGRLWIETLGYVGFKIQGETHIVLAKEKSRNEFIGGSNWVDVAADNFQAVGVQSDGILWSIQRQWNPRESGRWGQDGPSTLAKIGLDTDWSQAAGDGTGFLLLKKDGSLWTWGTRDYYWNHEQMIPETFKLDRAELPVRIGTHETFAEIFSSRSQAYARKNDGTVWRWTGWNDTNYVCTLTHDTNLDNGWSNFAARSREDGYSLLGVKTNGMLFMGETDSATTRLSRYQVAQVGPDAKWRVAAYGLYSKIWAIRDDGTLWQWATSWQVLHDRNMKPVQLGNRSDWVALTGNFMAGAALAADGSVWAWGQPSRRIWLAPSRRPIYLGNIFEGDELSISQ